MRDLLTFEDHEKLRTLADSEAEEKHSADREAQIVTFRKLLAEHGPQRAKAQTPGAETHQGAAPAPITEAADTTGSSTAAGPSTEGSSPPSSAAEMGRGRAFGLTYDFRKYLRQLRSGKQWDELQDRTLCYKCRQNPALPWITSCYHVYCKECLEEMQWEASQKDEDRAKCMECASVYTEVKPCGDIDFEELLDNEDSPSETDHSQQSAKPSGKRGKNKKAPEVQPRDWIALAGDMLPSVKTIAIKAQLLNWLEGDSGVKVIVYSQFLDMIRIMSRICDTERWGYETYHGNMTFDAREKALQEFADNPDTRVLLASLKCGGSTCFVSLGLLLC